MVKHSPFRSSQMPYYLKSKDSFKCQRQFESFLMVTIVTYLLLVFTGCMSQTTVQQTENPVPTVTQASSSAEAATSEETPSDAAASLPPVQYVAGVCGSEIPSTWHVRSSTDQAVWNKEGNVPPPSVLTADEMMKGLVDRDAPLFKPAVFSMADAESALPGHTDDPGSEDPNRTEVDILRIANSELTLLADNLVAPPEEYAWKILSVGNHKLRVLENTLSGSKYYGLQMVFAPAAVTGRDHGLIILNRSNNYDMRDAAFREGFLHFLSTVKFGECPGEW